MNRSRGEIPINLTMEGKRGATALQFDSWRETPLLGVRNPEPYCD